MEVSTILKEPLFHSFQFSEMQNPKLTERIAPSRRAIWIGNRPQGIRNSEREVGPACFGIDEFLGDRPFQRLLLSLKQYSVPGATESAPLQPPARLCLRPSFPNEVRNH